MNSSVVFLVAVCLPAFAASAAAGPAEVELAATPVALANVSAGGGGNVEGVVRYRADPKRPWRLSRNYVLDAQTSSLAEAVVALEIHGDATAAPSNPKCWTMDQVNFQFVPETMAVRAGDSIRILNSDDALHNVMTADGAQPFNVSLAKGQVFTNAFNRAGGLKAPIRLGCVYHGGMRAWVYVFDHPWFKVTGLDGRFRFENVPAGKYTLGVVHPAGKLNWRQPVEVKTNDAGTLTITLSPDDLIELKNQSP